MGMSSLEHSQSKFISVTEASQISGLTTSFIRRLLRTGQQGEFRVDNRKVATLPSIIVPAKETAVDPAILQELDDLVSAGIPGAHVIPVERRRQYFHSLWHSMSWWQVTNIDSCSPGTEELLTSRTLAPRFNS